MVKVTNSWSQGHGVNEVCERKKQRAKMALLIIKKLGYFQPCNNSCPEPGGLPSTPLFQPPWTLPQTSPLSTHVGPRPLLLHRDSSDWSIINIMKILQCYFEPHLTKNYWTVRLGLTPKPSDALCTTAASRRLPATATGMHPSIVWPGLRETPPW